MWLVLPHGFYSVVVPHPGDVSDHVVITDSADLTDVLVVRARVRSHLAAMLATRVPQPGKRPAPMHALALTGIVAAGPVRDYPYRVYLPRSAWAAYVAQAVAGIEYPNFKDAAATAEAKGGVRRYGTPWLSFLHRVWAAGLSLSPGHAQSVWVGTSPFADEDDELADSSDLSDSSAPAWYRRGKRRARQVHNIG